MKSYLHAIFFKIVKLIFTFNNQKDLKSLIYIDQGHSQKYENKKYVVYGQVSSNFEWIKTYFNAPIFFTPSFYQVLENAKVIGKSGIIAQKKSIWLSSCCESTGYLQKSGESLNILKSLYTKNSTIESPCISLINIFDANYFHWINDCLPSLRAYFHYAEHQGVRPKVLISPFSKDSFQYQFLLLLGVCKDDIIFKTTTTILCKSLLVYNLPYQVKPKSPEWNQMLFLNKTNYDWLREKLMPVLKVKPTRKVFVVRNTKDRIIVNQTEVSIKLKEKGFVTLDTSLLTVQEQVDLFSNTSVLVTVHGAGITNIAFSENVKIIEFFPENRADYMTSAFYQLSRILNFDHNICLCKADNLENITIDLDLLDAMVSKFE